jgi:hypothetical protein
MAPAALLVSMFMAACGRHSTNPSTETLTVYEDAPALKPLDPGSPGNSPGDAYYFSAALHSSPGGPRTGEVFYSKTLIKSAPGANTNAEKRATLLFSPLAVVRIKLSPSAVAIIPRRPPNLMRANLSFAPY